MRALPSVLLPTLAAGLLAAAAGASAAAARPSVQLYFQSAHADAAHQQKTFQRFVKRWKPPAAAPAAGKKTVVQAVLARDGKLVSAAVTLPSGVKAWDDAALAAVKRAAPYDPLPAAFPQPTVEVHFHVGREAAR